MDPIKFFAELRRRNVYKVAVAYGVVSWLLIQIATQVFPIFDIPNWASRLVCLILALGFPMALILAWLYELTPEGIARTGEVEPEKSIARSTGRKLDAAIILVLLAVIGVLIFRYSGRSRQSRSVEQSIAVLPFENRSEERSNTYFADGIQDEILTRLSKVGTLKVISRTSTDHYKSVPPDLPQIARELGVAYVLEGSVQKIGDAVRVNVQLIRAATDNHVWAETFDRKLVDIFSVESEVAKAVADQLRAHLSGPEEEVLKVEPTDNPAAYDAYLRGLAYMRKPGDTTAAALGAQRYFREAVRLDPKFALAWALLSSTNATGYVTTALQPTEALREETRRAAATARALQPKLGEAILAEGEYHYACLKDYVTAVRYFEEARQLLPNSSRIPESLAYVARRRGEWDRSESYFNEAERLDPRNPTILTQHTFFYIALRRFPQALRKTDQLLDITPDDAGIVALQAGIAQAEGDLTRAAALLAPLHPGVADTVVLGAQAYQAALERRPAQAISQFQENLTNSDPASGNFKGELHFWLGWLQALAGDGAKAEKSWREALEEVESVLQDQPNNDQLISDLALIHMGLHDKAVALSLVERAMAANPIGKDAIAGPAPLEIFARVAAQTGEHDRAISALQKLLSIPYAGALQIAPLTPALLSLDPMFDPLRSDPRFRELLAPPGQPHGAPVGASSDDAPAAPPSKEGKP